MARVHEIQGSPRGVRHRHVALCLLPHTLMVVLALGIWGGGYWILMPIVFLMALIPLLDWVTGWQAEGRFEKSDFSVSQTTLLRWNTRLFAVFYASAVVYVVMSVDRYSEWEVGLLIAAVGLAGGITFSAAHELLHAKGKIDQVLQKIATVLLFYPHYKLIHVYSHHRHVGTDHDENTAWLNESIYAYMVRTIPGSMGRCWKLGAKPRRPSAKHSFPAGFLINEMVPNVATQALMVLGVYLLSGWRGLIFYGGHLLVAHTLLESVNYIQHYGLLRKRQDGQYEKTGPEHSWDTYHFFTSYATFRVGHHSFHHVSMRPYYLLDPEPEAPKLPVGYFWAIPIVLVPPLWRRWINPRIEATAPGTRRAASPTPDA